MTRPCDNPFRVDRLHALPFEPQGTTWPSLLQRIERRGWRGAIVGPHGSGKTTLLHALMPRLEARGRRPRMVFRNREGGWAIPQHWHATLAALKAGDVLLADGYNHLGPMQRLYLRQITARAGAGFIVTAHHRGTLPTLIRTRTDSLLLARLIEQLTGGVPPQGAASALHRRHRGNLRDALRELYDDVAADRLTITSHTWSGVRITSRRGSVMLSMAKRTPSRPRPESVPAAPPYGM